jgi:hypothetical protein
MSTESANVKELPPLAGHLGPSERVLLVCDCCSRDNILAADDPELERDLPRCRWCLWPMDRVLLPVPA